MGRLRFSANLGFLWTDRSLPEAIHAAKSAGFDAVECHWPYDTAPQEVIRALQDTGLQMLGLNTPRGNVAAGENGLAALPGREPDARAAIDQAVHYAHIISASNIHVMAGFAAGRAAHETFCENLRYACQAAAQHNQTILIEPLNQYDAPGYFLRTTQQAADVIASVGAANMKLMFDCYHVQLMEGDLCNKLRRLMPLIGHIQFASVPDRGPPDMGEVNFPYVFDVIHQLGFNKPLGAEYKPLGHTDESLSWRAAYSGKTYL